ncbi:hypothetical protein U6S14_12440, partial [Cutibacterium acnes]
GGGAGASGVGGIYYQFLANTLGNTETVVVGAGGLGGIGTNAPDSVGGNGQIGGATSFAGISTLNETIYPAYPPYDPLQPYNASPGMGGGNAFSWDGGREQWIVTNWGTVSPQLFGGQAGGVTNAGDGAGYPSASFGSPGQSIAGFIANLGGGGGGSVIDASTVGIPGNGGAYHNAQTGAIIRAGG